MSFKDHPEYNLEMNRLDNTMIYLEEVILLIEEKRTTFKADIKEAYKSLDPSDSSLSYTNIMIGNSLLEQLEKNYRNYVKVRRKPYFARIDIQQKNDSKLEKLYIGKASLFTKNMESVIIDWRAPIANVYYDGNLGSLTYNANGDVVEAELFLKRQFTINEGQIENMMDIDITAKDEFLQASLAGNANDRLKEIASTIQAEQNAIIRADLQKLLVVQGVAGSGKTTIALHRIAYLIYTYEKNFDPSHFMIIAPNNLFLNYISEVLPELGVERVKQTTYVDYVMEIIGLKLKLTNSDERLNRMIEEPENPVHEIVKKHAAFKGSLSFRDLINGYIEEIEQNFIPNEDFYLGEHLILKREEIQNTFLNELNYMAYSKRLTQIKKLLNSHLEKKKKHLIHKLQVHYDKEVLRNKQEVVDSEERRAIIVQLLDERDEKIRKIENESKRAIIKYLSKYSKKKLLEYYYDFITDYDVLKRYMSSEMDHLEIEDLARHSKHVLDQNLVEYEDLAALVYLHYKIFGLSEKNEIRYAVMDEAQDFSLFEFYALKSILNTERFSILGDMSQGIHSYRGIKSWEDVIEKVFSAERCTYLTLEQSYRTTVEIMEMANKIIERCPIQNLLLAKPVLRHGEQPDIYSFKTNKAVLKKTYEKIKSLQAEGFHSIALIAKSSKPCMVIEKALKKYPDLHFLRINGKDQTYHHNLVIVPAYLAKGLEFDAVIILNLDESYEETELDLKLLYVAMTRALHRVTIIYNQESEGCFRLLD